MNILYLIRGLPNAGKTTLARTLARAHAVSPDDYHEDAKGNYVYKAEREPECQRLCLVDTESRMKDDAHQIAVHDPFTRNKDMAPYVVLAQKYGYRLSIITVERCHGGDNGHNVRPEDFASMVERWEPFRMP